MQSIITPFKAQKSISKGYESFLAYVLDTRKENKELEVFPDELPDLPIERQVVFHIDLTHGASLIDKYP